MAEFKDRLGEAMILRNLTAAELSRTSGVNEGAISQYRAGKYKASQRSLDKLARALRVSIPWLMGADVPIDVDTDSKSSVLHAIPPMKEWTVIGSTACGQPLHKEVFDQTVTAPSDINADTVFLCVGDSMINARIFDGDLVFVRLQPNVENGQIAVVRIGDEYTLKRVYVGKNYVELRAENPVFPAIVLHDDELNDFEIIGLAVKFLSCVK